MADKYCCFLHPAKDYALRELTDTCPACGNHYGFPLDRQPSQIGRFRIESAAGRGFYGVTYRGISAPFGRPAAVKVIPKGIYDFFGKDFRQECDKHYELQQNTEHLAKIEDYFDESVQFGDVRIECHVAVLQWIEGRTLRDVLDSSAPLDALQVAQVALDLLSLLHELERGGMRHNDLHDRNIVIAYDGNAAPRADRIRSETRAVAVDFGSVLDMSLSGDTRVGDLRNVGHHIQCLTARIVREPDRNSGLNWRLAFALDQVALALQRDPTTQRISFPDLREEIVRLAVHRAVTPVWRSSLELKTFSEHYNAQTIESAYVPDLFVTPSHAHWFDSIKSPGPQVISGMRGCGKTMLLKTLDFHARAYRKPDESPNTVIERIKADRFVGLFLACAKLLDDRNGGANLHVKLLIGYALGILKTAQHLRDLRPDAVEPHFAQTIARALAKCLQGVDSFEGVTSEYVLEEKLVVTHLSLSSAESAIRLSDAPSVIFPLFSDVIRLVAPEIFGEAHVLYLLDDVSTRTISEEAISELISSLLFSNEKCSFKFTTEAQTLELVLKSPGKIERASQGRDYTVFNLGAEVSFLIRGRGREGRDFIAEILNRRRGFYTGHPLIEPRRVLGDQKPAAIARAIGDAFTKPEQRKKIYWGISALTNLCVGDVGEVIRLYDDILKNSRSGQFPVEPEVQHRCFQHLCTSALHGINRRDTKLKDHALGFANAAHRLLRHSLSPAGGGGRRIRQYAQVYVSVSSGDKAWIYKEIRELLDAGIYVLDASTITPRTKRANSDPIQQFILTYRKLFGLSTLIGLSFRDRFELSGADLELWLKEPQKAEDVLIRNQAKALSEAEQDDGDDKETGTDDSDTAPASEEQQLPLLSPLISEPQPLEKCFANDDLFPARVEEVGLDELQKCATLIAGFGFEDRCEASIRRACEGAKLKHAVMLRYPEKGRTDSIERILSSHSIQMSSLERRQLTSWVHIDAFGDVALDISGLSKPAIFHFAREVLRRSRKLVVVHTAAQQYYPSDNDIEPVLRAHEDDNLAGLLEGVSRIFSGEERPYECDALLRIDDDELRPRALLAFSSAKHERLLTLIENRYYDYVAVAYSSAADRRARISEIAARFAVRNVNGASCHPASATSLAENIQFLSRMYQNLYHNSGYNVELGLTGSKMAALASAVVASRWKVFQAWYVRPSQFNTEKFTTGTGNTRVWRITLV